MPVACCANAHKSSIACEPSIFADGRARARRQQTIDMEQVCVRAIASNHALALNLIASLPRYQLCRCGGGGGSFTPVQTADELIAQRKLVLFSSTKVAQYTHTHLTDSAPRPQILAMQRTCWCNTLTFAKSMLSAH